MASAGLAGVFVPGLGRAAQPCPPPQVSAGGGTSASTSCTFIAPSTPATAPAWLNGVPLFTWKRLAGTAISNAGASRGVGAWSGAVYDPVRRDFIFNGGGHGDSYNNGVWAVRLGLDTPSPVQLKGGSSQDVADVSYYSDGTPSARHTYWHLQYVPALDAMMQIGGAAIAGSGNYDDAKINRFNLSTNQWSPAGTHADRPTRAGAGEGVCVDGASNVYLWSQGAGIIYKWAPATPGSFVTLATGVQGSWDECLAYDSLRNRLICFTRTGGTPRSVNASTGAVTNIAFSGPSASAAAAPQTTWWYVPERDSFLAVNESNMQVYECNASTFSVTTLAVAGSAVPSGGAIYARWNIARDLGVMLYTTWEEEDTCFFRYK